MRENLKTWLKKNCINLYWDLQIPFLTNAIPAYLPNSVLFVCKGNICRSPFAEHLAIKIAKQRKLTKMNIASAGLHVQKPLSPPEESIAAARAFGVDVSQHFSKSFNEKMIDNYNMIVVMEPSQLKLLHQTFPEAKKKLWLLKAFDNNDQITNTSIPRHIIPDPFGKSLAEFNACFKIIENCIIQLLSIRHNFPKD